MPRITLYRSETDTAGVLGDVTWERLAASLAEVRYTPCGPCIGKDCTHKSGSAWVPAHVNGARADKNVSAVDLAVFDLDEPTDADLDVVGAALEGYAYCWHQTHRGNGYRLVMPLAVPVPVAEWPRVWASMRAKFCPGSDEMCSNPSRLYFTPSRPEGTEFEYYLAEGETYDWRQGIEFAEKVLKAAIAESSLRLELSYDPGPVDREGLLNLSNPESARLMARVFKGERLAESGARDHTVNRVASVIAAFGPKAYEPKLVLDLLRPSIEQMPVDPEGLEAWLDKARGSYSRALARRAEREARERGLADALDKVLGRGPSVPASDAWRGLLLYTTKDDDGTPGGVKNCGSNMFLILEHDVNFAGFLRFNELTHDIEVTGGLMVGKPSASLHTYVANWFATSEYKLIVSSTHVAEQLAAVARMHPYNPVFDEISSVSWDGVPRIGTFFRKYLSARGEPDLIDELSRCFLLACVARAVQPGCQVQTVPVWIGKQGCGKSRSLEALGGKLGTTMKIDAHNKDSRIKASSSWIIELSELSGLRGSDMDAVKAFISEPADKLRPPYGRVEELFLRRCVFVGTTNRDEFLEDETGLRRWWPIEVGECDVAGIAQDRGQLFAEALVMYKAGGQWHLTPEWAERAEAQADQHKVTSIRSEQIVSWFNSKAVHERPSELTSYDIATRVLGVDPAQVSNILRRDIGYALAELHFVKARKRIGGQLTWYYKVPDDMLKAPRETKARPAHLNTVPEEDDKKEG